MLAEGGGGVVQAAVEVGRFGEIVHCYGEAGAGVVGPGRPGGGRGVWHSGRGERGLDGVCADKLLQTGWGDLRAESRNGEKVQSDSVKNWILRMQLLDWDTMDMKRRGRMYKN